MKSVKALSITLLAAAALLTSVLVAPSGATASTRSTADSVGAAPASSCSLVDFDSAVVESRDTGKLTLVVKGMKPSTNVTVELTPVVYIRQPEYWIILVNGCASGIGLPVLTPYVATLDITHVLGTVGIEVVGANQKLRIPVSRVG